MRRNKRVIKILVQNCSLRVNPCILYVSGSSVSFMIAQIPSISQGSQALSLHSSLMCDKFFHLSRVFVPTLQRRILAENIGNAFTSYHNPIIYYTSPSDFSSIGYATSALQKAEMLVLYLPWVIAIFLHYAVTLVELPYSQLPTGKTMSLYHFLLFKSNDRQIDLLYISEELNPHCIVVTWSQWIIAVAGNLWKLFVTTYNSL